MAVRESMTAPAETVVAATLSARPATTTSRSYHHKLTWAASELGLKQELKKACESAPV